MQTSKLADKKVKGNKKETKRNKKKQKEIKALTEKAIDKLTKKRQAICG